MLQLCRLQTRIAAAGLRTYATGLPSLPPLGDWHSLFPMLKKDARHRVLLHKASTAQLLAEAFLHDPDYNLGSEQGRTIIEAFPGPGTLSRALLQQPKTVVRRLILLEENETYLEYLRVCPIHL
jgi:mitochondrial transcription factor 1